MRATPIPFSSQRAASDLRLPLVVIAVFLVATAIYVGKGIFDSPSSLWTPGIIPPFEMTMTYRTEIRADTSFINQGTRKYSYSDERNWIIWNYPPPDGDGYLTTSELSDNVLYQGATHLPDSMTTNPRYIPTFRFVEKEVWRRRFDTAAARTSGAGISLEVRHEGANDVYRVIYSKGYGSYEGQQIYEEFVYIPELPVPVEVRWLGPDERVHSDLRTTSLVVDGVKVR